MTTRTEGQTEARTGGADAPVVISKAAIEAFAAAMSSIPEASQDGYESILLQLASVEDPSQLDAPWRAEGMRAYLDEPLEIRGLRRIESDYEGGLPFFLVVDAVSLSTGELVTFTTGAVGPVGQLAKAYQLDAIPGWRVIPRQADRPSANGYRPQHLEVMRGQLAREG